MVKVVECHFQFIHQLTNNSLCYIHLDLSYYRLHRMILLPWIHIQIPPDQLCSSHMTQYCWGYCSWSTVEGTLRVCCGYPQSTLELNGTPTCSSHSGTVSYETYIVVTVAYPESTINSTPTAVSTAVLRHMRPT